MSILRLLLPLLAIHTVASFLHFAHYSLAPVAAHSFARNSTIWFEVATAIALLFAIGRAGANVDNGRSRG